MKAEIKSEELYLQLRIYCNTKSDKFKIDNLINKRNIASEAMISEIITGNDIMICIEYNNNFRYAGDLFDLLIKELDIEII